MNYLKSLVEPVFNSQGGVKIRNFLGFKPSGFAIPSHIDNFSCSDLFFWRLDANFSTVFRFSDIPNTFYGVEKSQALIVVYDKQGCEIYREILEVQEAVTEIAINKGKTFGSGDYGTFSIFHLFDVEGKTDVKITNRCYVGYRFGSSPPSFVHGNVLAQYVDLSGRDKYVIHGDVGKVFRKPSTYIIQKNFSRFDYSELLFSNPCEEAVWIDVGDKRINLLPKSTGLIKIDQSQVLKIRSNLPLPRPIVFSFKGKYFDCHHG
jgi:hypothetical protein